MLTEIKNLLKWEDEILIPFYKELQNLSFISSQVYSVGFEIVMNHLFINLYIKGSSTGNEYIIQCEIPSEYPKKPIVFYEKTNIIPKIANRHIYPNHSLCFESPLNHWLYFDNQEYYISDYMPLLDSFIQDEEYFQIHGKYNLSKYKHGIQGILDSLQEQLPYEFEYAQLKILLFRILVGDVSDDRFCICGSGKKIYDCHPMLFDKVKNINLEKTVALSMLNKWYPGLLLIHRLITKQTL